jgi:tetratricopeptide (TPR) repeat protein
MNDGAFSPSSCNLSPAVEQLRDLPLDLAYSGVARIIMTLAYFRGTAFSPEGIQAALAFTSRAVQANPQSADAWVMRLWVATAPTRPYTLIAEHALSQARALAPNHPYLPDAKAMYYQRWGRLKEYEAALRRMIELAPTAVVRSAGYDRLALFYADHGRLDEAIDLYQQMLQESPAGSAWSWHNHSLALLHSCTLAGQAIPGSARRQRSRLVILRVRRCPRGQQ